MDSNKDEELKQLKWSYWDLWQTTPFMTTKQMTTYAANYGCRHTRQDRWIQKELAFTLVKNATKPNPFEIKPLQTTRKENNWKTEEALARAVVTLETERIKGSNPWCLWWWWWWWWWPWKYIKKARLLDTPFLYIFRFSVIVYNVDVGNNEIGTHTLMGGDRSSTVVKVLCNKSKGSWFDSTWGHWKFSLPQSFRSQYGLGVDSASNTNEYQLDFLEIKSGRCVRLTTLQPSWAFVM